jgi:hypothetical protein
MRNLARTLLLGLAFSISACGGEVSDDPEAALTAEDGKEDSARARLTGYYTNERAWAGQFTWLELRRDGTFAAGTRAVCLNEPCGSIRSEGRYTTRLTALYLTSEGRRVRYTYVASQGADGSKSLTLSRGEVAQFLRTTGSVSCGRRTCAGGYVCCNRSCGICTAPGNACIQIAC